MSKKPARLSIEKAKKTGKTAEDVEEEEVAEEEAAATAAAAEEVEILSAKVLALPVRKDNCGTKKRQCKAIEISRVTEEVGGGCHALGKRQFHGAIYMKANPC